MSVLLAEVFGTNEWVKELQRFDIRYVEQLGLLLSTSRGRTALSRLEIPVPYEEVGNEVDVILLRSERRYTLETYAVD